MAKDRRTKHLHTHPYTIDIHWPWEEAFTTCYRVSVRVRGTYGSGRCAFRSEEGKKCKEGPAPKSKATTDTSNFWSFGTSEKTHDAHKSLSSMWFPSLPENGWGIYLYEFDWIRASPLRNSQNFFGIHPFSCIIMDLKSYFPNNKYSYMWVWGRIMY